MMDDQTTPQQDFTPQQGKLQLKLIEWFGKDYKTTIAGDVAGLGGILLAVAGIIGLTTPWGQKLATAGAVIMAVGGQQAGYHAKQSSTTPKP